MLRDKLKRAYHKRMFREYIAKTFLKDLVLVVIMIILGYVTAYVVTF